MATEHSADIELGDLQIKVKSGIDAVRNLRTPLIQLAYALIQSADLGKKGLLLLADPKITNDTLEKEWHHAMRALQPQVMDRLSLVVFKNGKFRGFPNDPDPEIRRQLAQIVRDQLDRGEEHLHRGGTFYEILKILIHEWLLKKGPMTAEWLAKTAGCSYPTVASAVRRLGSAIKRGPDRKIELANFPREEWAKLVAVSDLARSTIRFADRSGQPRSPESLLRRLQKLGRPNIGVGGVFGAKHYHPSLDLVGSPRLDVTIHCTGSIDLGFVERLDPALRKEEDLREPANLVIHFLRRHDSLFDKRTDGLNWADPVECLLDLHESRLEPQALEFLNSFTTAKVRDRRR